MKFFSYVPLLGGLFNLALTLFVFGNDRRSRLNQVFFGWGLCITVWNFGTFALFQTHNATDAYLWAKLMQYGVIFIPVTMLHLSLLLTGKKPGRWLVLTYCFHGMLAAMNAYDLFISGVRPVGYAYYSVAGPGFYLYSLAFVQAFASIAVLYQQRRILPPRQRTRFNGILGAQTLLVLLGTNDLLPIFNIDRYPFTDIAIRPYGSLAAVAYGVMVAYSVFQHQLLDVHLALGKSAAYCGRFMFLVLIAVVLELAVAALAPPGLVTGFSMVTSICVIIVTVLLSSSLFPRLLGGTVETLERRLLGDHFEYQDKVCAFIEHCRWQTDLNSLLSELHALLLNTISVKSYSVILLDETNRVFTLTRAHPEQPQFQIPNLQSESPVFRIFTDRTQRCLPLGEKYVHPGDKLEADAREQLKSFAGDLVFPLLVESQPLGLLILGEKANGEPFTSTDLQLLVMVTENVSLVINQISLKNRLLLNQELDLLGRMSQGMAHDLNNLTTPVSTLLQLLTEGAPLEDLRRELAPTAMRNIQTMRDYIKEALFFSEHLRPQFAVGRLDELVGGVIEMAKQNNRKGKNIQYHTKTCGEVLVDMDHVLIRRLLSNLISNAVDASQKDESISVEIIPLLKSEMKRDWFRIRVTDHGTGIKPEDLERIFKPYFTTKKTGDEDRGFGLGLAICRKIANLHGGSLSVSSQIGKGTTVNLDIPNRQKEVLDSLISHPAHGFQLLKAAS